MHGFSFVIWDTFLGPIQYVQQFFKNFQEDNGNLKKVPPVFVELLKLTEQTSPGSSHTTFQWTEIARFLSLNLSYRPDRK